MNKLRIGKKNNCHTLPCIFVGLALLVAVVMYIINPRFEIPDIYINRPLLEGIYRIVPKTHVLIYIFDDIYINPNYNLYKGIYQILSLLISLSLFCWIFKIKYLSSFFKLPIIKNKLFIYTWINLVTILIVYFEVNTLDLYTIQSMSSPGINLGSLLFGAVAVGFLFFYIPTVNFIFYHIYSKQTKKRFVKSLMSLILYVFLILLFIETILITDCFFSWMYIIYYLYTMISIYIIVSALRLLKTGE